MKQSVHLRCPKCHSDAIYECGTVPYLSDVVGAHKSPQGNWVPDYGGSSEEEYGNSEVEGYTCSMCDPWQIQPLSYFVPKTRT